MQTLLLFFFRERFLPRSNQLRVFREVLLFRCWHAKQKSQNDHFFLYMYRVLPYIWFCREVFGFIVTVLVLSWGILFLSWGFCFCREVFGFAVRFLFLPWGFRFCREVFFFRREVFGFPVTVVGHLSICYAKSDKISKMQLYNSNPPNYYQDR